jgi:tetratricopeptide (TPR) repeat protein
MSHLRERLLPSILVAAATLAVAAPAGAQNAGHTAPKLVTRGTNCTQIAGAGVVMVQVFVRKDNSFDVRQVLRSTNHGDDEAALEIARSSTYQAATAGGQPVDEFYDYQLDFSAATAGSGASAEVCAAIAMVRDGQYAGAKGKLTAYLADHPADRQAYLYLGLADAFSKDAAGATVAFDRAGTIDPRYASVASQAYVDRAQELLREGKFAESSAAAARAIEVQPGNLTAYYLRGVATERQNPAAAIPFLEKARSMAAAAKVPPADQARIVLSLVSTYAETGDFDKAAAMAKEAGQLDPSQSAAAGNALFTAYMNSAVALANGGKHPDAIARFEAGAAAVPAHAATLYARAAYVLATDKPVDWKKVKAEADKAIAADPADGLANFMEGLALAGDGKVKDSVPYLNRAKSSALYTSDSGFAKQVDDVMKQVGQAAK